MESTIKVEAKGLIEWRRAERNKVGVLVRSLRAMRVPRHVVSGCIHDFLRRSEAYSVMSSKLRAEARRHREFSERCFGPLVMSDGYALCGMEDARAESQAFSGRFARVLHCAANIAGGVK